MAKKTKVRTIGSVVSQLRDNQEFDFIEVDGITYIPLFQKVEEGGTTDAPEDVKPEKKTAKPASKKPASKKEEEDEDEEEEEEKPAKKSKKADKEPVKKVGSAKDEITDVITAFDEGDLIQAKAVNKLMVLTGKSKGALDKILTEFSDDEDGEIKTVVKKLMAASSEDEEEEEEEEKPTKKSKKAVAGKKKTAKENLVEPDELEKGQKVSVYWGTDPENGEVYDEWFTGVVKSIKGGVPTFKWDEDGEVNEYDEELMEKIKLVDDEEEDD